MLPVSVCDSFFSGLFFFVVWVREEWREKGLGLSLDVWTRRDKVHADAAMHPGFVLFCSCALSLLACISVGCRVPAQRQVNLLQPIMRLNK